MIRLKPEKAGVKSTLARAVAGAYAKAVDKNISIETEEFTDVAVVHDPGWTAEAIGNVLDNGVKYAPVGTCITIRVSELVSYVMIEVEDEGPGIPAEEQHRIFQRFYRGKAEAVRKEEGSGVGLYLTRRILEEQGGTVCVKNGRTGGSKFVITLPKE
nr:HAMP domain-containing sensor histidine kinase [Mordavella massiliensis]